MDWRRKEFSPGSCCHMSGTHSSTLTSWNWLNPSRCTLWWAWKNHVLHIVRNCIVKLHSARSNSNNWTLINEQNSSPEVIRVHSETPNVVAQQTASRFPRNRRQWKLYSSSRRSSDRIEIISVLIELELPSSQTGHRCSELGDYSPEQHGFSCFQVSFWSKLLSIHSLHCFLSTYCRKEAPRLLQWRQLLIHCRVCQPFVCWLTCHLQRTCQPLAWMKVERGREGKSMRIWMICLPR